MEIEEDIESGNPAECRISENTVHINIEEPDTPDNLCFMENESSAIIHLPKSAFQVESSSEEEDEDDRYKIADQSDIWLRTEYANIFPEIENSHKMDYNRLYVTSNSPMASNCNSDLEDQPGPICPSFVRTKERKFAYKKFTYEDIENSLSKYYDQNERVFTEMDVIITYLKGIKLVYTHSKTTAQTKLYCLVMFIVGLSMSLSILAPFVKDEIWGFYLLSAGNALITILIATTRYLKLDYHAVGFSFMATQYSKIESKLDFATNISCKQPPLNPQNETNDSWEDQLDCISKRRVDALRDLELKITEIREMCNVLVPENVIRLLPLIYNTNIFRFIKKMEQYKTNLIIRFRDIKNEIHYILYKWNSARNDIHPATPSPRRVREKNRLLYLMDLKEKTKQDLILCKTTYTQMDELFNKEIRYAETHQSCFLCASWFRPDYDFSKLNPVVRDYVKLVVPD